MTTCYAAKTEVPSDNRHAEIKCIRTHYGTDNFLSGWNDELHLAALSFRQGGRFLHINNRLSILDAFWSAENDTVSTSATCVQSAYEQAVWWR